MAARTYIYTRWLEPGDAWGASRLERSTYSRLRRAGWWEIRCDLKEAADTHSSLSMGLFDGSRLVGYMLAYIRPDRREVFDDFEVQSDAADSLHGPAVYIEDVVIRPSYRRQGAQLFMNWFREKSWRAPDLPIDAFCERQQLEFWRQNAALFANRGLEFDNVVEVRDLSRSQQWYWVSLAHKTVAQKKSRPATRRTGHRLSSVELKEGHEARILRSVTDLQKLAPDWRRLLDAQTYPNPFLSLEYVLHWWKHFGLSRQLFVVAIYCGDRVVSIAPMMISPAKVMYRVRRRLEFIGDKSLTECPGVLYDPSDPYASTAIWHAIAQTSKSWDTVYLREQLDEFGLEQMFATLKTSRFLTRRSATISSYVVQFDQSWERYLSQRSRSLRKGFNRKLRKLQKLGALELVCYEGDAINPKHLDIYVDVEKRGWKHAAKQGVASRPDYLAYFADLFEMNWQDLSVCISMLTLDQQAIAATFGISYGGNYSSLEITHDSSLDTYSPGFVLTGLELKSCHESERYRQYDFLAGTPDNKKHWATGTREEFDIFVFENDLRGRGRSWISFTLKPRVRSMLKQLGLHRRVMATLDRVYRWLD